MKDFLLFGFILTSVLFAYLAYKNYVLLKAERTVGKGLKLALNALIESKQKKPAPRKKK